MLNFFFPYCLTVFSVLYMHVCKSTRSNIRALKKISGLFMLVFEMELYDKRRFFPPVLITPTFFL